eukprot:7225115-Pyramimonas_sp.AAC.1
MGTSDRDWPRWARGHRRGRSTGSLTPQTAIRSKCATSAKVCLAGSPRRGRSPKTQTEPNGAI